MLILIENEQPNRRQDLALAIEWTASILITRDDGNHEPSDTSTRGRSGVERGPVRDCRSLLGSEYAQPLAFCLRKASGSSRKVELPRAAVVDKMKHYRTDNHGVKTIREHTISCAIMPPMLIPKRCNSRLFVQPRLSRTSITSLAISDVEYRISGLSDSPIPRLSRTSKEYRSPFVWARSRVSRCQAYFIPPRPIMHYIL